MFGKGVRICATHRSCCGRNLRPQNLNLLIFQLKHEITGETGPISFHLLIEPLRGDVVEHCEVHVQNYPMPANGYYEGVDIFDHSVRSHAFALTALSGVLSVVKTIDAHFWLRP